jgi:hypothetical protein
MQGFTIEGRRPGAQEIRRIPAGSEPLRRVLEAAETDGLDQVVVRLGSDRFVASGRGMAIAGLEPGDEAAWGNRTGEEVEALLQDTTAETIQAAGIVAVVAGVALGAAGAVASLPVLGAGAVALMASGAVTIVVGELHSRLFPGDPGRVRDLTEAI